jgi:hypothetical protein
MKRSSSTGDILPASLATNSAIATYYKELKIRWP